MSKYLNQPDDFVLVGKKNWLYVSKKALYGLFHSSRDYDLTQ